jgi:hypothetical protein
MWIERDCAGLIEKMGVSRLPPSYRHVVVSLGTILLGRARVKPWFLFPIALSDSYLCTSTEGGFPSCASRRPVVNRLLIEATFQLRALRVVT